MEHLTKQFLKIYEVEIGQVLGVLGTLISRDTNRPEENQAPTSSSSLVEYFPDTEMSLPDDTTQEEPHTEVNTLVGLVEEPLLIDQGEENPDSSQKQKSGKSHNRIRKLKWENKLLKRRVNNIKLLKHKVDKLRKVSRN